MLRATHAQSSPNLQSAHFSLKHMRRKGATTGAFGTASSRNMPVFNRQDEIADAIQKELDAFEEEELRQE